MWPLESKSLLFRQLTILQSFMLMSCRCIHEQQVTVEKNELKDENVTLEAEIAKLHDELRERLQSEPMWHNTGADPTFPVQPTSTALPLAQPPAAPLYMVPFHQDLETLPEAVTVPKPAAQVTRPHARYPTPSDSWPMQILSRHQHSGSSCSISGDEGSDRTK